MKRSARLLAPQWVLPVLLGLEVDYFPETIEAVSEYLAQYPFDFLIGSIHWVGPWAVDHEDATWEFDPGPLRRSQEVWPPCDTVDHASV